MWVLRQVSNIPHEVGLRTCLTGYDVCGTAVLAPSWCPAGILFVSPHATEFCGFWQKVLNTPDGVDDGGCQNQGINHLVRPYTDIQSRVKWCSRPFAKTHTTPWRSASRRDHTVEVKAFRFGCSLRKNHRLCLGAEISHTLIYHWVSLWAMVHTRFNQGLGHT